MTRKLNAPASAGWHHLMNRVDRSAAPSLDRAVAEAFLARLGAACATLPVDLHAYCLLPRHFHILVRAPGDAADALVEAITTASARPRPSRPRRVPVALGRHLMEVSRYVHLNPVEAGLAWRPEDWPFSSFRGYLGDLTAPPGLTTAAVLGRFGGAGARHRYRAYVYAGMDPGTRDIDGRPRWSALFADGSLLEDLAWRVEPALTPRATPIPGERALLPLIALARRIAAAFDVPVASLRAVRQGGPRAALARGALVHAARARGGYRLSDVAAWMRYASPAAAAAAAERFERAIRAAAGSSSGT